MNATAERIAPGLTDEMAPALAKVAAVTKESFDTFTLKIAAVDRYKLPRFAPGQFSMLYVFGVGELPISISGDPQDAEHLLYTVRSVGKTTHALVSLRPGDYIGIRGPYGTPWPVNLARGKDVLIVAGGIGIAPLRPVVHQIMRRREEYGRLLILYGARSPRDLLFRKELDRWSRLSDTQVLSTVDYGGLNWHGHVGVVTALFRYLRLRPLHTIAMVCGPEIMMRGAATDLEQRGLPTSDLYISMERNMKCGIGLCGHCQCGPVFICKDGPIFPYARLRPWLARYEV